MPERVQLSRAKGWRMPPNTLKVDRTTKWGNPWVPGSPGWVWIEPGSGVRLPMILTQEGAVDRFRRWLRGEFRRTHGHPVYEAVIPPTRDPPDPGELRGKNLACWCKLGAPCHADVLLELANA